MYNIVCLLAHTMQANVQKVLTIFCLNTIQQIICFIISRFFFKVVYFPIVNKAFVFSTSNICAVWVCVCAWYINHKKKRLVWSKPNYSVFIHQHWLLVQKARTKCKSKNSVFFCLQQFNENIIHADVYLIRIRLLL